LIAGRLVLPICGRRTRRANFRREYLQYAGIQAQIRSHQLFEVAAIHESNLGVFLGHCGQAVWLIAEDRRQSEHRAGPGVKAHYDPARRRLHYQRSLSALDKVEANGGVSLAEEDSVLAKQNLARTAPQSLDQSRVRRK